MPNKTRRGAHRKKVSVAAYCSTIAAYWPKRLHIRFFIENCKKWVKNHYLEHFEVKKGNFYLIYQKKPLQLHTAAHLQHTGQKCSIWEISLKAASNGLKMIIWDIL